MSHVSRLNTSCDAYEWVMPNLNESCHTYERVISHTSRAAELTQVPVVESCHTYEDSCHTYDWVMSHIWMSHVTRMNESCHTHPELQNSRKSQSLGLVIHMKDSCHTYELVRSHICMSHVTRMNESCHTHPELQNLRKSQSTTEKASIGKSRWLINNSRHMYEWVMTNIWTSHVTNVHKSCQTAYGVAMISRLLKIIGLSCRISPLL